MTDKQFCAKIKELEDCLDTDHLKIKYLKHLQIIRQKLSGSDSVEHQTSLCAKQKNIDISKRTDSENELLNEQELNEPRGTQSMKYFQILSKFELQNTDATQSDQTDDIQTIFEQKNFLFDNESLSLEYLDIHYNPPKKRSCLQIAATSSISPGASKKSLLPYDKQMIVKRRENKMMRNSCPKSKVFRIATENKFQKSSSPHMSKGSVYSADTCMNNLTVQFNTGLFNVKPEEEKLLINKSSTKEQLTLWQDIKSMELKDTNISERIVVNHQLEPNMHRNTGNQSFENGRKTANNTNGTINKIAMFCSMLFKQQRSNQNIAEKIIADDKKAVQIKRKNNRVVSVAPKPANTLLNIRKHQDCNYYLKEANLDIDNLSNQCTKDEDETDQFYNEFCPICFCF